MEKRFIKNRKGLSLAVIIEPSAQKKGLVFVMHGLGGFKEQPHILAFASAFTEQGFNVVRFDTTNTIGESEGRYEDATITNYHEDLEDVISWASGQEWYQEPFVLVGHSLGGISTALYAEQHPEKVLGLAPISPVVAGKMTLEAHVREDPAYLKNWEESGWLIRESTSKPGVMKKLPWSHVQDRLRYDLLPDASRLSMPVLLVVGEDDSSTPPDHVRLLYDAIPGEQKEMHIIRNAPHTFRAPSHLEEIKRLLARWIGTLHA